MNKQTLDSSKFLDTVFKSKNSQNSLDIIAASVSQLPSDVIDKMLAHAANELEKRKSVKKMKQFSKFYKL